MNKIEFVRGQGGVVKALAGEDHISGFLMYLREAGYPLATEGMEGFSEINPMMAISTIERAESLGITAAATDWEIQALHYHLSEVFRVNPGVSLYVGLFRLDGEAAYDFSEVKRLQNYGEGRLRQMAVYAPGRTLNPVDLTALQGVADTPEQQDIPLSLFYGCKIEEVRSLPQVSGSNKKNVSVVIGQAGDGRGAALFTDSRNMVNPEGMGARKYSVTCLGTVLGIVSKAAVHESIAWVQKFPTGIDMAAFADGTLFRNLDRAEVDSLDQKRYVFAMTYSGLAGTYLNDSHTLDDPKSDYAYIEAVRTMDKAVRGIRTYVLPYLGSPLQLDPETGKLKPEVAAYLEVLAGRQLEDMERAGELSGYDVKVDPDQNVLVTSKVVFTIRKVQVGVMRTVSVNIGFTTKLD